MVFIALSKGSFQARGSLLPANHSVQHIRNSVSLPPASGRIAQVFTQVYFRSDFADGGAFDMVALPYDIKTCFWAPRIGYSYCIPFPSPCTMTAGSSCQVVDNIPEFHLLGCGMWDVNMKKWKKIYSFADSNGARCHA